MRRTLARRSRRASRAFRVAGTPRGAMSSSRSSRRRPRRRRPRRTAPRRCAGGTCRCGKRTSTENDWRDPCRGSARRRCSPRRRRRPPPRGTPSSSTASSSRRRAPPTPPPRVVVAAAREGDARALRLRPRRDPRGHPRRGEARTLRASRRTVRAREVDGRDGLARGEGDVRVGPPRARGRRDGDDDDGGCRRESRSPPRQPRRRPRQPRQPRRRLPRHGPVGR